MGQSLRLGPALCWLALSAPALADTSPITQDLPLDPAWLTLMHYQQDTLGGGYTSQADDSAFFISATWQAQRSTPSLLPPYRPFSNPAWATTPPHAAFRPAQPGSMDSCISHCRR